MSSSKKYCWYFLGSLDRVAGSLSNLQNILNDS